MVFALFQSFHTCPAVRSTVRGYAGHSVMGYRRSRLLVALRFLRFLPGRVGADHRVDAFLAEIRGLLPRLCFQRHFLEWSRRATSFTLSVHRVPRLLASSPCVPCAPTLPRARLSSCRAPRGLATGARFA